MSQQQQHIRVTVRDFRTIDRAEVDIGGITLVGGINAAGKSSLQQAVAALLSGDLLPRSLAKKDADKLVRSGQEAATAQLVGPDGTVAIEWPKCKMSQTGMVPKASSIALGMTSPAEMSSQDRAGIMIELLNARPTNAELAQELTDAGFSAEAIEKTVEAVASGWDFAADKAVKVASEARGAWKQVTGETYGPKKADDWQPAGWRPSLANATEGELEQAVANAKAALEAAVASAALDADKRAALTEKAAERDKLSACLLDAEKEELRAHERRHTFLLSDPPAVPSATICCPHCGGGLALAGGGVTKADAAPTAEEIAAAKVRREKWIADRDDAERKHRAAYDAVQALRAKVTEANAAAAKLRDIDAKVAAGSNLTVADARAAVEDAQTCLDMFRRHNEASKAHKRVCRNVALADILGPEGLRRRVLVRQLAAFQQDVDRLTEAAGWSQIRIAADLSVSMGGFSYAFLSESYQARCRIILQVALAQRCNDALVLIDRADMLDAAGRNGLFRMLRGAGVPALITMTAPRPDALPDLRKAGLGRTYWLEGGVTTELSQMQDAAAA